MTSGKYRHRNVCQVSKAIEKLDHIVGRERPLDEMTKTKGPFGWPVDRREVPKPSARGFAHRRIAADEIISFRFDAPTTDVSRSLFQKVPKNCEKYWKITRGGRRFSWQNDAAFLCQPCPKFITLFSERLIWACIILNA